VAESQESGGTNVVTITFTDGTSITFNVKNGERGEGVTQETLERIATALQDAEKASSLATSAAAMAEQAAAHVTPHVSLSEEAYEELVNNDEVDPNTIYMTYEE
jgi:dihydroxyacetone kinase